MRAGTTDFIKVYYTTLFLIRFSGCVSSKKTPLKDGILSLFAVSSNLKLLKGLFGKITFSTEIVFYLEIFTLYLLLTQELKSSE